MGGYDRGFEPPGWWLELLSKAMRELDLDNADVARLARVVDGREKKWGPDRITKLRGEFNGTIRLVQAVSKAVAIPSPVVTPDSAEDAEALDRWLRSRQSTTAAANPDQQSRERAVAQALDSAVKQAEDQTRPVASTDEGSPRGPRTRRASRSR
jgi:hypothetical protein